MLVKACLVRGLAILAICVCRQSNGRQSRLSRLYFKGTDASDQRITVFTRHADVANQDVGPLGFQQLKGALRVLPRDDGSPFVFKDFAQEEEGIDAVVND